MQLTAGGLVQIQSYLDVRLYERLQDLAAENDRSIAAEIRRAVAIYLALNAGEVRVEPDADGGVWLEFDHTERRARRPAAGSLVAAHSEDVRS